MVWNIVLVKLYMKSCILVYIVDNIYFGNRFLCKFLNIIEKKYFRGKFNILKGKNNVDVIVRKLYKNMSVFFFL